MDAYHEQRRRRLADLSKDQLIDLIEDGAKNWLAHDGLWFLAAEKQWGLDRAIDLDGQAWERFTVIEAKRIMKRHRIQPRAGLKGLDQALGWRLYAHLNVQEIVERDERSFVFRMKQCRVQTARHRDGRPDFPCKPVGLIEYSGFARTIDDRIRTECVCCPPDDHPDEYCCAWRFSL
ncbi:MAG: hypothetical protein DRI90_08535 [Deltaproteobacteria bacterium]|nr:MAG: hypothetical protein DRI90_08535 [Deltaproteobacteria bacterium]